MLWSMWRYGGVGARGVYESHNGPGSWPPRHPDRLDTLMRSFGLFAYDKDIEIAGMKQTRRGGG